MKIAMKYFVGLSSYINVSIKRFRINYLEQIRKRWFRLFFLVNSAINSYGKRLKNVRWTKARTTIRT